MDIDTTADILTESHTYLAEPKSHGLTSTFICEATSTGKCWDEIKGILRSKLCNANIHIYTSRFMKTQQKDNETLADNIHHYKTSAKWCAFDNDTMAINIFVKDLRFAPTIASKIYKMDPQTLAEVIRLVETFSAAHQMTATLTPSTVSMIFSDNKWWFCGWTGHFGHCCPDALCYGCDELGHFAQDCPTRFLHQEHHATTADLIQGINTSTTRGTDHTPIMVQDKGDITTDHSPVPIHTTTKAALEGTPHTLLPATTAAHATLQPMDAVTTPHAMITTGTVAPHALLTISPTGATHTTWWTEATLTPAAPTTQHKILSPGRQSNAQGPQPPINPTTPKLSPSRILLQTPHQILAVMLIL